MAAIYTRSSKIPLARQWQTISTSLPRKHHRCVTGSWVNTMDCVLLFPLLFITAFFLRTVLMLKDFCWPTVPYAKYKMKNGQRGTKTAKAGAGNRSQSQQRLRWLFSPSHDVLLGKAEARTSQGSPGWRRRPASAAFRLLRPKPQDFLRRLEVLHLLLLQQEMRSLTCYLSCVGHWLLL